MKTTSLALNILLIIAMLKSNEISAGEILFEEQMLYEGGRSYSAVDRLGNTVSAVSYTGYRAPAMVKTDQGTIIVAINAKPDATSDHGRNDVVIRRSTDNGQTWGDLQIALTKTGANVSGYAVADLIEKKVIMLIYEYPTNCTEHDVFVRNCDRTLWSMESLDDGATWSVPEEITLSNGRLVNSAGSDYAAWGWKNLITHGIQLRFQPDSSKNGRLVFPGNHTDNTDNGYSHILYSDDHGETWHIGAISDRAGSNESSVMEMADGTVYLNSRSQSSLGKRFTARSTDGGESFYETGWDPLLYDPVCEASVIRFTDEYDHDRNRIIFTNPTNDRYNLAVKLSYDEGYSWSFSKVIKTGFTAYSDNVIADDDNILTVIEVDGYTDLILARYNLEWITDGEDRIDKSPEFEPFPAVDAVSVIEAEEFDAGHGVLFDNNNGGGLHVQNIQNGEYIIFRSMDFGGGIQEFSARVASNTNGGNIEIRLDSLTGTLAGTCEITGTGGWQAWTEVGCDISNASGVRDLYLRFTGEEGTGLFNIDRFEFSKPTSVIRSSLQKDLFYFRGVPYPVESSVRKVLVYDLSGRFVREMPVLSDKVKWNGRNRYGKPVAPGSYIARLVSKSKTGYIKFIITD